MKGMRLWTALVVLQLAAIPSLSRAQLVSYWPAEGNANDVAGTNDGTLINGTSFAPGIQGLAFSLDGQDDHVLVPDDPTLNFGTQDFSISTWIKTGFYGSGAGTDFLVSKIDAGTLLEYSLAYSSNIDGAPVFGVGQDGRVQYVSAGPNLGDKKWHHVVSVRSGTEIRLYIDCHLVSRAGCGGCAIVSSAGPRNVVLGGRQNPGNDPYFNGLLDEVAIYGLALTGAEIGQLYEDISGNKCPKKL